MSSQHEGHTLYMPTYRTHLIDQHHSAPTKTMMPLGIVYRTIYSVSLKERGGGCTSSLSDLQPELSSQSPWSEGYAPTARTGLMTLGWVRTASHSPRRRSESLRGPWTCNKHGIYLHTIWSHWTVWSASSIQIASSWRTLCPTLILTVFKLRRNYLLPPPADIGRVTPSRMHLLKLVYWWEQSNLILAPPTDTDLVSK